MMRYISNCILEDQRLTPVDYERNVFHLEFDVGDSGLTYKIGDALGVYGQNNIEDVRRFLSWLNVDEQTIVSRSVSKSTTEIDDVIQYRSDI